MHNEYINISGITIVDGAILIIQSNFDFSVFNAKQITVLKIHIE